MKLYSSNANAHRAARKAGLAKGRYTVFEEDGQYGFTEVAPPEVGEEQRSAEAPSAEASQEPPTEPPVESPTVDNRRNVSTVESPVKKVWAIADAMPGAKRKDVIAACVEQGIAFNTARTQYQKWKQSKTN